MIKNSGINKIVYITFTIAWILPIATAVRESSVFPLLSFNLSDQILINIFHLLSSEFSLLVSDSHHLQVIFAF